MPRKTKYPPYEQAKQMALDLQLNSRSDYQKWHKKNNCEYLPRFPERAYAGKGWENWNAWLGTANIFKGDIQQPVRPFWEAVKWSQEFCTLHNINTYHEWYDYWKEHDDERPEDIPLRPDIRYVEWSQIGWKGWLGVDLRAKLEAAKKSTALFSICSYHSLTKPGNIYAIVYADKGEAELLAKLGRARDLVPIRTYKIAPDQKDMVLALLNRYGRDDGEGYFIPLINDLIFELDMNLTPHLLRSAPTYANTEMDEDVDALLFGDKAHKHIV